VEQNTKESNRLADNQHFQEPIEQSLENRDIKFSPDLYQPGDENKLLRRVQGAE
jgi:hypothetical protein